MKKSVFILILILPTICLLGMERDEGSDKERRNVSCVPEQPQRKKVHLNPAEQAEVDNQLVKAAALGSIQLAEEAFQKGADINARSKYGQQLIHIAANNGRLEMVEWLIANGADINCLGAFGWQPIHFAAESGELNLLKLLVKKGADINARTKEGYQLIHCAADNGHLEMVEWLIANGADINSLNEDDWQPIHCAARFGRLNVLKLLVERGADINARTKGGDQLIHFAARKGHLEMVEWLIAHGAYSKTLPPEILSKFSTQSLVHAVLTRNTEKIKEFLRDKFDVQDFNKIFPLMIALGQHLIEEFSDDMLGKVTEETWKLALEAAASHTNNDIFNWVYQLVRERLPEDKVLIAVESALLWATINVNERVVGLILEHAFCDGHVSNLSLSAAGRRLNYVLIHNGSLTTEQRASLIRIRRMLVDAAQAINKAGLLARALQPNDPAETSLAQLPSEVLTNIARYLFRST